MCLQPLHGAAADGIVLSVAPVRSDVHSCKAGLCDDCFCDMLRFGLRGNSLSSSARGVACPFAGCCAIESWETVSRFTGCDEGRVAKLALQNYLKHCVGFQWCGNTGCGYGAIVEPGCLLECAVCAQRCSWCKEPAHSRCPVKASHERDVLFNRIAIVFKRGIRSCPSCREMIEKNQGCQHMTCRHCQHQFCWHCKGDWSSSHKCFPRAFAVFAGVARVVLTLGFATTTTAMLIVAACAPVGSIRGLLELKNSRDTSIFRDWATGIRQCWANLGR